MTISENFAVGDEQWSSCRESASDSHFHVYRRTHCIRCSLFHNIVGEKDLHALVLLLISGLTLCLLSCLCDLNYRLRQDFGADCSNFDL